MPLPNEHRPNQPTPPNHQNTAREIFARLEKQQAELGQRARQHGRQIDARSRLKNLATIANYAKSKVLTAATREALRELKLSDTNKQREVLERTILIFMNNNDIERREFENREIKKKQDARKTQARKQKDKITLDGNNYRINLMIKSNDQLKKEMNEITGHANFSELVEKHKAEIWNHLMQIAEEKSQKEGSK